MQEEEWAKMARPVLGQGSWQSRKLISRFRCGCHDFHADTGKLLL